MVMDACTTSDIQVNYHFFWLVPSCGLFIMLFVLLLFFKALPREK
jgi:hypothetical protein